MALHRLASILPGVPNVATTAAHYEEFGLTPAGDGRFATADGGEQLVLVHTPRRRLVELGIGADDPDALELIARSLARLDAPVERGPSLLAATDAGTEVRVVVRIAERLRRSRPPTVRGARGPRSAAQARSRGPRLDRLRGE